MKTFKEYLAEVNSTKHSTAVLTFGRLSPPTTGHAKLIDHVLKQPGDHHVYVSHTQDNTKNPLSAAEKIHYLKQMYPNHKHVFHAASSESPSILTAAAHMHEKGYKHLHVVVGQDRVDHFHELLHKYNGQIKDGKGYHFHSIKVTSAGDRDPDADGVEGMSASKMREHAKTGNLKEFTKGLHPNLHKHAKEMMDKIRSRLK